MNFNMQAHKYNLGIIGNCSYLALIDSRADVKWLCLPRFDSSFLFGSLIDEQRGGHFYIRPASEGYSTRQYYISNTNVLCTEFVGSEGSFVIKDCAPRFLKNGRLFRPIMLIRKIERLDGSPSVRMSCEPRGDYGNKVPEIVVGSNHIRFLHLGQQVRLTTDVPLTYIEQAQSFILDQDLYVVLTYGEPLEAPLQETAEEFIQRTVRHWQQWIKSSYLPDLYQDEMIRSLLVLKLHQYEDTGAIIASATTSLPEFHDSTRNWDYRYCWFRDSYYTLRAFNQLGHFDELERYFDFLHNILHHADGFLQPVYAIDGEQNLSEQTLDLQGYMGNKPVRIGNKAYVQKQHDVYGQVLVSLLPLFIDKRLVFFRKTNYLQIVPWLLKQIERTMMEPDSGLWEFRCTEQLHTYTLIFHWAGSKAAFRIASRFDDHDLMQKAQSLALAADKLIEQCYDPDRKLFTDALNSPDLDASTLAMITMDYLDHRSEKAADHIKGLEKELLADHGLFYRYRHGDDLGFPESTFLTCAFWRIEAMACVGRIEDAITALDQVVKFGNHLGIFSEDASIDGSQWGNFPQTYCHVGLINAVTRLARKMDRADFL